MPVKADFFFKKYMLDSAVGGLSALELPRLDVRSLDEALSFIQTYGYDLQNPYHLERAWVIHRRAVTFLRETLLEPGEEVPEMLADPNQLRSPAYLLLYASQQREGNALQRWACALLRIMHVYSHLQNDLFSFFSNEIQEQILKPIQSDIQHEPGLDAIRLGSLDDDLRLAKFEVKPFKATASSMIKLLAKPDAITLTLLDKLGVRFVTRGIFDSFRVIRYLFDKHIISLAHIIPDQSNNTLYPVNLFLEVVEEMRHGAHQPTPQELEAALERHLQTASERAVWRDKHNAYTGKDYRFIKFINRKLIEVSISPGEGQARPLSFFYPYEIQIMDYDTYIKHLSGPSAHDQYKERQRKAARLRVFGTQAP